MDPLDVALVFDHDDGQPTLHRIDCPLARAAAAAGRPVMSMLGVSNPAGLAAVRRCPCMGKPRVDA